MIYKLIFLANRSYHESIKQCFAKIFMIKLVTKLIEIALNISSSILLALLIAWVQSLRSLCLNSTNRTHVIKACIGSPYKFSILGEKTFLSTARISTQCANSSLEAKRGNLCLYLRDCYTPRNDVINKLLVIKQIIRTKAI